jgi:putative aldouronate transport system substrate-binding protein
LINNRAVAWPAFTFTRAEEQSINDVKKDLDTYVKSTKDAWIMGTTKLDDTTWKNYINTIQRMGVEEVVNVYNNALKRAYDNGFKEGYYTADQFK